MAEIVLHHFMASPYSEKLRAILGFKGLAWHSVLQPRVMPKPDLMALTGGYRRTPVLQLGRDVYCDTRLAARVLERLAPAPTLVPSAQKASIAGFVELEQMLFFGGVATCFAPAGLKASIAKSSPEAVETLVRDRATFFTGGTARRPTPDYTKTHFLPLLLALDAQLAERPFLLGEAPTLADFIAYHPVWYVHGNEGVRSLLDPFHRLHAWRERIAALGHGRPDEMAPEAAIALARDSTASQPFDGPLLLPEGVALGQRVRLAATDYGVDPVEGVLVHASAFEIAVRRTDPRAGEVTVHVPRHGFAVGAAD